MISENEAKVLKTDTDFIIYCCVSLKKIKNIINYLNEELNFIKNDIKELNNSSDELKTKIEEFCKKTYLNQSEKMKGINLIKEIFKPFYDNMISVCENNHINKIKNLKNEFNDIMIGMSDPEFYPPNVNSFNTSLNKENEFESNNSLISLSKLDKNENTQEELISGFNDFVDDYINNNNGYIKSYNNTNNNVNIKKESFNISEMNKSKFNPNNNTILKNELMISNKNKFDLLENNFYSDDDIEEEEEKYLKNDGNEFSNNCNKFYYIISLITKGKNLSINKVNIKQLFLNNIKAKLNIKENNIFLSFDNSKKFIEVYIKTKEFASSSINIIKRDYPDFNKLFEYKMLYDHILNIDKRYLNYFDYNGNTISPNSSLNSLRGKEEYDPPYGWFGIGLNIDMYGDNKDWIENKTNKSKWAIAYHGVGQFLSNDQVKKKIVDIIILKDLIQTKKQKYSDSKDKRSTEKKKIGKGIYLTPKIKLPENFAGIININNKKYKVLLMARVLIEKIREPEDIEYWILNKEDIRFYRILIKQY